MFDGNLNPKANTTKKMSLTQWDPPRDPRPTLFKAKTPEFKVLQPESDSKSEMKEI